MTDEELAVLDRYWRAANYLSVGQIYRDISSAPASVRTMVVAAREDLEIVRHVRAVLGPGACLSARGRVTIETLGRNYVVGLSWMQPPYQWRFGATAAQPMQAYAFDARAVRAACDADPVLGYELSRRFFAAVTRRLQATRARLLEAHARIESRGEPGE